MSIEIKIANSPEDIETIRELFKEYQDFLGVDLCFQNFSEEMACLPGKYAAPEGRLYLATVNGKIAGCVAFYKFNEVAAELKRLYVRGEFRGVGLGRILMETAINDAKNVGYNLIRLDSLARLKEARKLYDKFGFVECEAYNLNPEDDVYYMEKAI